MSDKTITQLKEELRRMENSFADILAIFSDNFGVVITDIDIEVPGMWNQQGEWIKPRYIVKIRSTIDPL